jgi:hypothetical protein
MKGNTATIDVQAFRADWLTHMPMRALCQRWSITRDQVIRLKHVWKLPPRHDRKLRVKPERRRDPTPAEIEKAKLEIQATWSKDVREDRAVIKTKMVTVRRIPVSDEARHVIDEESAEIEW